MSQQKYPLLPLRDIVMFPHMIIPLFIGRKKSVYALETIMSETLPDQKIVLVTQKNALQEDPAIDELYEVGTIANVLQLLKLPDGTVKILVEGESRFKCDAIDLSEDGTYFEVSGELIPTEVSLKKHNLPELEALKNSITDCFEQYMKLNKKIPHDLTSVINQIVDYSKFSDTIASYFSLKIEHKQELLETFDIKERLEKLLEFINHELEILDIQQRIRSRVKGQMEKSQRDYYLHEQLKAIYQELNTSEEGFDEITEFEKRLSERKLSEEAEKKARAEIRKLRTMNQTSAEAVVVRNYLDWLLDLPWNKSSKLQKNLERAEQILDENHYGLEKIKERIIEFLSVQLRVKKIGAQILCLVGPPGVGKTSLGKSIAEATGRKFCRISLGGVRDEAEIRGHRRTYIGSMPGKIIQTMRKAGTKNPMILLDEIDKVGSDWRGDPASALLEVLDPEQNVSFHDHYLEVDYDLSDVLFVATANTYNMLPALFDRFEVINLSGYTDDEKYNIAMEYLVPKQVKLHGLKENEIKFEKEAIYEILRLYTREAGVRNLEREIAKICRKTVLGISKDEIKNVIVNTDSVRKYCGIPRYSFGITNEVPYVGVINGMAWTEVGGELLKIEAVITEGAGKTLFTGKLGDVMQESIQAAITLVRSVSSQLKIKQDFAKIDIHIHVPQGATPKDGPSAGIAMFIAIVSALTGKKTRKDIAMTGEITITGRVLPIGGLKEKLLAAQRGGIKTVLIPQENEKNLEEVPQNVKENLEIILLQDVYPALDVSFVK